MELVGEFLGLDQDQAIFDHFRRYHRAEFPKLAEVDRTTFARQAANLWRVKQLLQQRLSRRLVGKDAPWITEDQPAVLDQLRWLNGLGRTDPKLAIVPSHDDEERRRLVESGVLGGRFE